MQINFLVVIGVGLATLFVGYFVGLFEGRDQGYKKRGQEEPEGKRLQPQAIASKENNLLKLSLDDNNQLRLDLDGQRADATQLAPEQRKRLIALMMTMRPWIDASASKPVAPQPTPAAPVVAPISQPASNPAATAPVPTSKKKEEAKTGPLSMVAQIDEILQTNLANSSLANRAIRLMESPGGGVVVMVGLDKYNGVGDVPDPQVQAVLRAAIAEWEKKYTPGG